MHSTKAMFSILATAALAATTFAVGASTAGAEPAPEPVTKVTICHRTNSDTNPYVQITPDVDGVLNGHAKKHDDPFIWGPTLKASHQKWGDIIPPFWYMDGNTLTHFDGLNWTTAGGPGDAWTGESVWNNDCSYAEQPAPPATGSLEVTKTVEGTPAGTPTPVNFTVHVSCDQSGVDEDVVFGPTGDLAIGATKTFDDLLSGDTCTVTETGTSGFSTGTVVSFNGVASADPSVGVDVQVPDDDSVSVTVDNDFTNVKSEVVVTDPGTPVAAPEAVAPAAVVAAPQFTG